MARKLTYIVDLLGKPGETSFVIPIVCACVGGVFVLLGLALCIRNYRRRRQTRAAADDTGGAQLAQVYPAPHYTDQIQSSGAPYSGNGGFPGPIAWQGPPLSREELEAMSVEQLRELKNKMCLGSYGLMSRENFIDMVLTSQAAAAGAPPPSPSPTTKPIASSSLTNPVTGALECGLCFEPMGGQGQGAREAATPPCRHLYCRPCLIHVARNGGSRCPACRELYYEWQIAGVRL